MARSEQVCICRVGLGGGGDEDSSDDELGVRFYV